MRNLALGAKNGPVLQLFLIVFHLARVTNSWLRANVTFIDATIFASVFAGDIITRDTLHAPTIASITQNAVLNHAFLNPGTPIL